MHILAGYLKHRELKAPRGDKTRPTSSKLRASIFDILQHSLPDARVLDIFAGSGAMGLEALSRGAASALFIEQDRNAAKCIKENISYLELSSKTELMQMDAFLAVKKLAKAEKQFDLIYIDPPYSLDIAPLFDTVPSLLSTEGIVIVEQSKRSALEITSLKKADERKFGDTVVLFFSK